MDQRDEISTKSVTKTGALSLTQPALFNRRRTARILGDVHVSTIIRLERRGLLHPIRLNKHAQTGQVFYRVEEVMALLQGANDAT
jgi:hypothetical protein